MECWGTVPSFFLKLVEYIKKVEGLELTAYKCPANVFTIGYGETGKDIFEGVVWTKERAEERLRQRLRVFVNDVDALVTADLTDNQFIAVVSLVYNIGLKAFEKSTILKKLNTGDIESASKEFKRWNKVDGKVLNGLVNRRKLDLDMFLSKGV